MSSPSSPAVDLRALPDTVWLRILSLAFPEAGPPLAELVRAGPAPLDRVAADVDLWRLIRVREDKHDRVWKSRLGSLIRYFNRRTTEFHFVGLPKKRPRGAPFPDCFPSRILNSLSLRCPNLVSLSLENTSLGSDTLASLPRSLQRLCLAGSNFVYLARLRALVTSPLLALKKRLPNLKELDVSETGRWLQKCDTDAAKAHKKLQKIIANNRDLGADERGLDGERVVVRLTIAMAVIHRALCTWFVVQIFIVLLVLRLDERVRWSWFIVFVPVWLHDAAMLTSLVVKVATGFKNAPEVTRRRIGQYVWCLVSCLLKIAFQVMLCLRLEGLVAIPLYYIMFPLWIFLPFTLLDLARELKRGRVAQ